MHSGIRKYMMISGAFLAFFLAARYLLPLFLPFLLGASLALAAEPLVRFLSTRLHIKRWIATGIGVSMAFSFLVMILLSLCAFLLRELQQLAGILPELESALRTGMDTANQWLTGLAGRLPGELGQVLTRNVNSFFTGGSALLDRITGFLLRLASGILSQLPNGALGFGTGLIASFMISGKLPQIKTFIREKLSAAQILPVVSALKQLKATLGGWLKAQVKLSSVTFGVVLTGLLIFRVPHAPLWGVLVALVDAFPILGTGTVLIPWSLVSFLQGDRTLAFALLGLYGAVTLIRSVLEPRFLGKQFGLDPLVTLIALYAGYRLWGIGGMILAPMLAVAAFQLVSNRTDQSFS